jgi:hypothetical protein
MHKKRIAVLADATPELRGEANSRCHRDFPGHHHVTRGQRWIGLARGVCSFEKDLDALFGDLLCRRLHLLSVTTNTQNRAE